MLKTIFKIKLEHPVQHKPYLVKVTTEGGVGSKIPKILTMWFMDDPLRQKRHYIIDQYLKTVKQKHAYRTF